VHPAARIEHAALIAEMKEPGVAAPGLILRVILQNQVISRFLFSSFDIFGESEKSFQRLRASFLRLP
jgi:hypothetical protein